MFAYGIKPDNELLGFARACNANCLRQAILKTGGRAKPREPPVNLNNRALSVLLIWAQINNVKL
jgi:hypothetical protein